MNIYLIRHGKDCANHRGGWSDLGLIEEGLNQVKLLGEYLYKNNEKYKVDTLISSDLRRVVETTQEIEKKIGVSAEFSSEWREMNNGLLAGMLNSEALEKYPGLFFNTLEMDEQYPGGESPIEFYERIEETFNKLCNSIVKGEVGPNVMVVTHSGVINIIYHIVNGLKWTNKCDSLCKITTTGIHEIVYGVDGWKVIQSNNIEHLL